MGSGRGGGGGGGTVAGRRQREGLIQAIPVRVLIAHALLQRGLVGRLLLLLQFDLRGRRWDGVVELDQWRS